jgi:hypothetical protein
VQHRALHVCVLTCRHLVRHRHDSCCCYARSIQRSTGPFSPPILHMLLLPVSITTSTLIAVCSKAPLSSPFHSWPSFPGDSRCSCFMHNSQTSQQRALLTLARPDRHAGVPAFSRAPLRFLDPSPPTHLHGHPNIIT